MLAELDDSMVVKRTVGMGGSVKDQPMAQFNDTSIVAGSHHRQLALEAAQQVRWVNHTIALCW